MRSRSQLAHDPIIPLNKCARQEMSIDGLLKLYCNPGSSAPEDLKGRACRKCDPE